MRKLRFILPLSAVLLAFSGLAFVVSAQSEDWETLRPEGEEFSVSMPKGSTFETAKEPYHRMELNTRVYLSQKPNGPVFAVVSLSGIKSNPAMYTEMQRFNSYVDAFKTLFPPKLKGKITPVKLVLVGEKSLYGRPGREYRMSVGDASGTVQTFATRRRFYAVAYLNVGKDDSGREQFLSSFVLPEQVNAPAATAIAPPAAAPAPGAGETPKPASADISGIENPANLSGGAGPGETRPGEPDGATKRGRLIQGGVLNGRAISLQKPDYPPEARAAGISGPVTVQVTVDEAGNVIDAKAVSGHVLLRQASVSAALQAKFAPTSLMGEPVKVTGVIVFNFAK